MLKITIPAQEDTELFDERTEEFITIKGNRKEQTLQLEHSLVSLSKWESKWHKPFMEDNNKTQEEMIDYVRCMTLTSNIDPEIYNYLSQENIKEINEYIKNPMTATTINDRSQGPHNSEILTSELIYYYMIAAGIPFECQKWHLNRLITLIRICGIKSEKPKMMGRADVMSRNAALNAARRKKLNTKG